MIEFNGFFLIFNNKFKLNFIPILKKYFKIIKETLKIKYIFYNGLQYEKNKRKELIIIIV